MSIKVNYSIFTLLFILSFRLAAQDNSPPKWELNGYVKNMQITYLLHQPGFTHLQENLLHNRLNFKWYPHKFLTFKAELRSRFIWGERLKLQPDFATQIREQNNDFFQLSINLIEAPGMVLNSMMDRFYLQYEKGKWNITLGRQRINWGINTLWNPHDIFNAYSFTDFDYEERPGSDALRIQYYTGMLSSVEFALSMSDKLRTTTAGLLWKTNKWNYDFQFLAGVFDAYTTLGIGWAGNIKNIGFKGEIAYFGDWWNRQAHSTSMTVSGDYIFKNKLYWSLGVLYNSLGDLAGGVNLLEFELSARNLYPYQFAISNFIQYPIRDNLSFGTNIIYSPGQDHAFFLSPVCTYNIKDNWDLDFTGQISVFLQSGQLASPLQAFFMRIKWSF